MVGIKGRSGKPKDKPWQDALRLVAMEEVEGDPRKIKKLRKVAEACVEAAMAGDMQAIQEIGNRLDGRPTQVIDGHLEVQPGEVFIELLNRISAGEFAKPVKVIEG